MTAFSVLSSPVAGWKPRDPPVVTPLPANATKPAEPDWRDYAGRELWREAIIAYLRTDHRKCFRMWKVLNELVGESGQGSRFDVRAATFEALAELMQLRRERIVYRHRRSWIAINDLATPLPQLD